MADGDDCKCYACCIGYCSCGADWTSQEVYDLRNKVSQLQAEVARLTDENAEREIEYIDREALLSEQIEALQSKNLSFWRQKRSVIKQREAMLEQLKKQLEDRITLPTVPPEGLLLSMAIRFDHGLGVQGYYDDPMFGPPSHQKRLERTMRTMNQLYEEVSGGGFFTYPIPQDKGSDV